MSINYTGTGGGIPRKAAKIFAKDAANADMTVFGSTLANNTTYTTDLDSIQSSHYEVGWREAVISNLNYPLLSDMNGLQHTLSQQIAYVLQHGVPEWNSATTYYAYDIVQSGGILYTSIIDNNTNNVVTDTTKWAVFYNPAAFANISLSNLDGAGENHFLNKRQITNCIIAAPSGIPTVIHNAQNNRDYFAIQGYTRILIADGLNSDGSLKNIEYTYTTYAAALAPTTAWTCGVVLANNSGTINYISQQDYTVDIDQPSNPVDKAHWYNPATNIIKAYNASSTAATEAEKWEQVYQIPVATFVIGSDGKCAFFKPYTTARIYTSDNALELAELCLPAPHRRVEMTIGASNTEYTAPATGWVHVNGIPINGNNNNTSVYIYGETGGLGTASIGDAGFKVGAYMPICAGDKFTVIYDNVTIEYFGITYARGEI